MKVSKAQKQFKNEDRLYVRVIRNDLKIQQMNRCAYCYEPLKSANTTFDHLRPRSKGGSTSYDNGKAVCFSCNQTKGSMSESQYKKRIKKPLDTDNIYMYMAWSRRKVWLRAFRACQRISDMVGTEYINPVKEINK